MMIAHVDDMRFELSVFFRWQISGCDCEGITQRATLAASESIISKMQDPRSIRCHQRLKQAKQSEIRVPLIFSFYAWRQFKG